MPPAARSERPRSVAGESQGVSEEELAMLRGDPDDSLWTDPEAEARARRLRRELRQRRRSRETIDNVLAELKRLEREVRARTDAPSAAPEPEDAPSATPEADTAPNGTRPEPEAPEVAAAAWTQSGDSIEVEVEPIDPAPFLDGRDAPPPRRNRGRDTESWILVILVVVLAIAVGFAILQS